MALYDHASYVQKIYDDEQAARDFRESFAGTALAQRHESARAERESQAAAFAVNSPIIRGEVDAILKANPTLSLETAFIVAGKNLGVL